MKTNQVLVLVGVGLVAWYLWAQSQLSAASARAEAAYPGGPQYGGTSMQGTSGTGITNPLTAITSGISNILTRLFAQPTNAPGNITSTPSGSSSRLPSVSEPPTTALALPASPSPYYYMPPSPELYLPNLGDPNLWWASNSIDYYQAAPQDISSQNVSLDVPITGWFE